MPLSAINESVIESRRVDEDVEVRMGDRWCFGMLAEWRRYEALGWVGWVRYNAGPGENMIGQFLAEDIRPSDAAASGDAAAQPR